MPKIAENEKMTEKIEKFDKKEEIDFAPETERALLDAQANYKKDNAVEKQKQELKNEIMNDEQKE